MIPLQSIEPVWDERFPAEQARIVQLLVERVMVSPTSLRIDMKTAGMREDRCFVCESCGAVGTAGTGHREAVLAGKQPADLTLKNLMAPFPVEWSGQRAQFGIEVRR